MIATTFSVTVPHTQGMTKTDKIERNLHIVHTITRQTQEHTQFLVHSWESVDAEIIVPRDNMESILQSNYHGNYMQVLETTQNMYYNNYYTCKYCFDWSAKIQSVAFCNTDLITPSNTPGRKPSPSPMSQRNRSPSTSLSLATPSNKTMTHTELYS